jgi:biopolymer transport protein TolR
MAGFRNDDSDEFGAMSEINVTPLVDVMLVLLVIFMITAPLMTEGLTVELPPAEGRSFENQETNPSKISISREGVVYLDGARVAGADLETSLGSMLRTKKIKRALLEADQNVSYGAVVKVIDVMNRAGVEQLGMLTRPAEDVGAGSGR